MLIYNGLMVVCEACSVLFENQGIGSSISFPASDAVDEMLYFMDVSIFPEYSCEKFGERIFGEIFRIQLVICCNCFRFFQLVYI